MVRPAEEMNDAVLFALRVRWAEAILSGQKTVEVRRSSVAVSEGCLAVLYATAPLGHVLGCCRIDAVYRGPAVPMWRRFGPRTGLTRDAFLGYLDGSEATCIELSRPRRTPPAPLSFAPPQSWMRLQPDCPAHLELLRTFSESAGAAEETIDG